LHLGYNAAGTPIRLAANDRKTHMHVIGSSGSGKSKFLEWMMRGDLTNRQGFCLIDPHGTLYQAVADYCAHRVLDREVILLNLSEPGSIIGFNPFLRAQEGDISVQVDRRIAATMRAWNAENTDETPTLDRILRLIYTVMLELNLGLPQVKHLIDFDAQQIRKHLIDQLPSSLIQREWGELHSMRVSDWRKETLSAKNRLFKFLTSETLARFMGVPGRTLNLKDVMDEGKVLLVNLAPSDHLSHENARVFGALLINEFFESALRRKSKRPNTDPDPYYLYMDEFQDFVALDVTKMLDQVRKFGLFAVLSHQRFGQLDNALLDGVLTNCKIKAVFGGLRYEDACMLANEMFLPDLNTRQIKKAYHHTSMLYEEQTRVVKSTTTGSGTSDSENWNRGVGSSHSIASAVNSSSGSGNSVGASSAVATAVNTGMSFGASGGPEGASQTEGWFTESQGATELTSSAFTESSVDLSSTGTT
jgi:type IV secretory pathway TraG/TraD family ATPase VirD4